MATDQGGVLDALPAMVWTALPDGNIDFANRHWSDYTGLSLDQGRGWEWQAAVEPGDLPQLLEKWRSILASGEPGEMEARVRRSDGQYRWFRVQCSPMRDEAGRLVKWCGVATDVDDFRRAEQNLRGRELEFQLIVDSIPVQVAVTAPTGEVEGVNQPTLDYFGKTLEELKGWKASDVVHPDDLERTIAAQLEAHRSGSAYNVESRHRRADGVYRWYNVLGMPLRDRQGNILRWLHLLIDIDDRKRAEEGLARARSELAHVARVSSLGALTASIAHEVNQPLSGIITNASTCLRWLAADPPNVDGARETAHRTIRDGNRAADVIARLRALFSKRTIAIEPLDLNEAAREVVALSWGDLQRGRVVLRTELADGLPLVGGDRIQLQQVIMNLLRNATDAMSGVVDRPRRLLIRTGHDERNHVRLSVEDAGIGFGPQVTDRLFEAFYTTKSDGMGIGLSVSRSIIECHGGRLWAQANDGPGATFSFSIPEYSVDEVPARDTGFARTSITSNARNAAGIL